MKKYLSAILVIILVLAAGTVLVDAKVNGQGDVDLDTQVNIKDATLIQKHLAKLVVLEDAQLLLADVDGSIGVNIKDATHLQKWIAGLVDKLFSPKSDSTQPPFDPDDPVELPLLPVI